MVTSYVSNNDIDFAVLQGCLILLLKADQSRALLCFDKLSLFENLVYFKR